MSRVPGNRASTVLRGPGRGNAPRLPDNTFTDHEEVLAAALKQVPSRFRRKIIVRVDGAGASHALVKHLLSLNTMRKKVLFTTGWMITAADEDAIGKVPAAAWKPGNDWRARCGRGRWPRRRVPTNRHCWTIGRSAPNW